MFYIFIARVGGCKSRNHNSGHFYTRPITTVIYILILAHILSYKVQKVQTNPLECNKVS